MDKPIASRDLVAGPMDNPTTDHRVRDGGVEYLAGIRRGEQIP